MARRSPGALSPLDCGDWCQGYGYFFDILGGGGQQALAFDIDHSAEPCISVSVKLFGISKGAFNRFFSSLVEPLAPVGQAVAIGTLAGILPNMAGDGFAICPYKRRAKGKCGIFPDRSGNDGIHSGRLWHRAKADLPGSDRHQGLCHKHIFVWEDIRPGGLGGDTRSHQEYRDPQAPWRWRLSHSPHPARRPGHQDQTVFVAGQGGQDREYCHAGWPAWQSYQ